MKIKLGVLILVAIGVLALAVAAAGKSPAEALRVLLQGSLGTPAARSGTLKELTPLLFASIGVFFALRAGLFNIGIEGQFLMGALTSCAVALKVTGPGGMVLALGAGAFAGALWALPAGLIKAFRNGHEVITTIMFNNIATAFAAWAASGPLKAPDAGSPTSANIDPSTWIGFWTVGGVRISHGIWIGILLVAGMWAWLRFRVAGYEFRCVGENATAAKYAGVNVPQQIMRAMLVSGAAGGLGGAIQVLSYEHRFYDGFSPGYGFDSLGVALLAGSQAWLLLPASALFGILAQGGTRLDIMGVPKGITVLVLGLVILVAAAIRYRREDSAE